MSNPHAGAATPSTARRLGEWLATHTARPFSWPQNNCCHFAAAWVAHAAGVDPLAGLPKTGDGRAALRLVRQMGGSLASAWTQQMGRPPIAAAQAQVGDVVLMQTPAPAGVDDAPGCADADTGTGQLVGICAGRSAMVMDALGALHHVPMERAQCAWRLHGGGA